MKWDASWKLIEFLHMSRLCLDVHEHVSGVPPWSSLLQRRVPHRHRVLRQPKASDASWFFTSSHMSNKRWAQWATEGWQLVFLFNGMSVCIIDIVHPQAFQRVGLSVSPPEIIEYILLYTWSYFFFCVYIVARISKCFFIAIETGIVMSKFLLTILQYCHVTLLYIISWH